MEHTKAKHLDDTSGLSLIQVASFLDLRFKVPKYDHVINRAEARKETIRLAVQAAEQFPAILQAMKIRAAEPDRAPLSVLGPAAAHPKAPKKSKVKRAARASDRGEVQARAALALAEADGAVAARTGRSTRPLKRQTSDEVALFGEEVRPEDFAAGGALGDLRTLIETELKRFELFGYQPNTDADPVAFWRDHQVSFPMLSHVARQVFAVPASTANVERLFSAAGRAINRRRPRLKSQNAAAMLFGHANVVRGFRGVGVPTGSV